MERNGPQINQEIAFARLCTAAALLALTIACVGLCGTMSYGVSRRTSEIGVRMALGARRATVVWMVLRDVLMLASIGLAISVPAALAASKVVESFPFETNRNDDCATGKRHRSCHSSPIPRSGFASERVLQKLRLRAGRDRWSRYATARHRRWIKQAATSMAPMLTASHRIRNA